MIGIISSYLLSASLVCVFVSTCDIYTIPYFQQTWGRYISSCTWQVLDRGNSLHLRHRQTKTTQRYNENSVQGKQTSLLPHERWKLPAGNVVSNSSGAKLGLEQQRTCTPVSQQSPVDVYQCWWRRVVVAAGWCGSLLVYSFLWQWRLRLSLLARRKTNRRGSKLSNFGRRVSKERRNRGKPSQYVFMEQKGKMAKKKFITWTRRNFNNQDTAHMWFNSLMCNLR